DLGVELRVPDLLSAGDDRVGQVLPHYGTEPAANVVTAAPESDGPVDAHNAVATTGQPAHILEAGHLHRYRADVELEACGEQSRKSDGIGAVRHPDRGSAGGGRPAAAVWPLARPGERAEARR